MAIGAVSNALIFAEDWAIALQEQLDEPTKWKNICNVMFVDRKVFNNPYHTDITVQTHSPNTPFTPQALSQTNENVTIATSRIASTYIDRAEEVMSYAGQMEQARRHGILLNEAIETSVYADHANWTNFGNGDITGGTVGDTTTITVSATNIDDIVRHVKRVFRVASGDTLLARYGGSIVWRPADFELLEGFMMASKKIVGHVKFLLIDLEALLQGATGGKQAISCAA